GMHLAPDFGLTVREIEQDGYDITERVEMVLATDSAEGWAKSVGLGVLGFAQIFARRRPDIVLIVGDRLELLSVGCAALPFRIPIAHVSGGDVTEGAVDNQVRHAITKMSHIHFVAMKAHAERLLQMGEEAWRVMVVGEPALDLIRKTETLSREELGRTLGMALGHPVLVITFHPTTLGSASVEQEVDILLTALKRVDGTLIFTYPNADAGNRVIVNRIREFAARQPMSGVFANLGRSKYYNLLTHADLMVGNSSSGIWEAPSFRLPVVNIGDRQQGRVRARNVIDVSVDADAIYGAIQHGLEPSIRAELSQIENPYGDGLAAGRIVKALKHLEPGVDVVRKRFVDRWVEEAGQPGVGAMESARLG
ncbi:MAG: UDP-N-acetylglucosamine 2-epimerase, partial [Acidimicrobiia bacterium]